MSNPATQFKLGNNANPNGRPKKEWTMKSLIEDALNIENEEGTPRKVVIANKLASMAMAGDITAIKEVNNRIDGMPVQDITSGGEAIVGPTVYIPKEETDG